MISIRETSTGAVFRIRVVPRASRNEAVGIRDDALKLRITAPPVEGKANEACIALLAELLGVKRTRVTIVAGHASRAKTVEVKGARAAEIVARFAAFQD